MDSKNNIPYGLVLHPSIEEFSSPREFVERLDKDQALSDYGIVKIVPPAGWSARAKPIDQELERHFVSTIMNQELEGEKGIYKMKGIKRKSMTFRSFYENFKSLDSQSDFKEPEKIESQFWKTITYSSPVYGIDILGSLFDRGVTWNLNEFDSLLREGLSVPIPGVTKPYLYVGSWKAMFSWHKEDLDLYSINFLHYGKPKFWYCLPASESHKLENFVKTHFPECIAECPEYIRHKTLMISPYVLKKHIPDLKVYKMIQHPGEFVITVGGAYHSGFNWGFNIAEAVNFATVRWLDILPSVQCCKCFEWNVDIDRNKFCQKMLKCLIFPHYSVLIFLEHS